MLIWKRSTHWLMTPFGENGIKGPCAKKRRKKIKLEILCKYCSFFFFFQKNPSPSEVVQWSNHRVMEWLRSVDLAEFAPNLRGSGVHGGLIVSGLIEDVEIFFFWTCLEPPLEPGVVPLLLHRSWSPVSTQRLWPCSWIFLHRRLCYAVTWPQPSLPWWGFRRRRRSGSTPTPPGTCPSPPPPKSRSRPPPLRLCFFLFFF